MTSPRPIDGGYFAALRFPGHDEIRVPCFTLTASNLPAYAGPTDKEKQDG